jgi:four helix bundle protein
MPSEGINETKGEGAMEKGYKKLFVWKKADELSFFIYQTTKNFPKEELYGLTSQLRRAVLSIPLNIAEGAGRFNQKENRHFVNIAMGSLYEVEYLLDFCLRLNYFNKLDYDRAENLRNEVGALLWRFYKSL